MADIVDETKDAGTYLMAEGHVDEGMAVDALREELIRLRALIANGKPICPHCQKTMTPSRYKGYYDTFDYWGCECEGLPTPTVYAGAFV